MSPWISKIKEYQKFYNVSYKDAMKMAKDHMTKKNLKLENGAPSVYVKKNN
jgi:hypothetical protein